MWLSHAIIHTTAILLPHQHLWFYYYTSQPKRRYLFLLPSIKLGSQSNYFFHWPATSLIHHALLPFTDVVKPQLPIPGLLGTTWKKKNHIATSQMSVSTGSWETILTGLLVTILSYTRRSPFSLEVFLQTFFLTSLELTPQPHSSFPREFFFTYVIIYGIFIEQLLFARP